jgi:hypothetical protein
MFRCRRCGRGYAGRKMGNYQDGNDPAIDDWFEHVKPLTDRQSVQWIR